MANTSSSGRPDIMVRHRIRTALELTRELLRSSPIKPDLMPEYVALQMWPFVVPLYHGIEQALKCLLLLQTPTVNPKSYSHDLKSAFRDISAEDRHHIEFHFSQHLSLHADYQPNDTGITNANTFIEHISSSGTNQEGSETWRYLLLEGVDHIPRLHLWGMLEIWDAACCQMQRYDEEENERDSVSCSCLATRLSDLVLCQHTGRASPYSEYTDDVNEWFQRHASIPLAAWIDLLSKTHRQAIYEVDAPYRLLPSLVADAETLLRDLASEPEGTDERRLMTRIEETGGYLTWDYTEGMFRVSPTPSPMVPNLPNSEGGVRVQVSDLLLEDSIRMPTLSSLQWTAENRSLSRFSDHSASSAPAMYWSTPDSEVGYETSTMSPHQQMLDDPNELASVCWRVVQIERVNTPRSPVQERWITAHRREVGFIRVRLRDNQQVLDCSSHAGAHEPSDSDYETGRLFYYVPDKYMTSEILSNLRHDEHRYKILFSTESKNHKVSILLTNCRTPREIPDALRRVLGLLGTPSHRLNLVNDVGADWKVMATRVDSSRFPLNQIGVVHRHRISRPSSHIVESVLPAGSPALHVDLGNSNELMDPAES